MALPGVREAPIVLQFPSGRVHLHGDLRREHAVRGARPHGHCGRVGLALLILLLGVAGLGSLFVPAHRAGRAAARDLVTPVAARPDAVGSWTEPALG